MDLPPVTQGLERARGDMQVIARDRGAVVVHRLLQCPFRVPYLRKSPFHFFALAVQIIPRHGLLIFNGSVFEIFGHVLSPVEKLATYVGVGQDPFVPIGLQGAFRNVQQAAHVRAVDSSVRGLRVELLPYLHGKGG